MAIKNNMDREIINIYSHIQEQFVKMNINPTDALTEEEILNELDKRTVYKQRLFLSNTNLFFK